MGTSSEEMARGRSVWKGESEGVAGEKEENLKVVVAYKPTPHLMERRKTQQWEGRLNSDTAACWKTKVTEDKSWKRSTELTKKEVIGDLPESHITGIVWGWGSLP